MTHGVALRRLPSGAAGFGGAAGVVGPFAAGAADFLAEGRAVVTVVGGAGLGASGGRAGAGRAAGAGVPAANIC
jgi:hypothetical protein